MVLDHPIQFIVLDCQEDTGYLWHSLQTVLQSLAWLRLQIRQRLE